MAPEAIGSRAALSLSGPVEHRLSQGDEVVERRVHGPGRAEAAPVPGVDRLAGRREPAGVLVGNLLGRLHEHGVVHAERFEHTVVEQRRVVGSRRRREGWPSNAAPRLLYTGVSAGVSLSWRCELEHFIE